MEARESCSAPTAVAESNSGIHRIRRFLSAVEAWFAPDEAVRKLVRNYAGSAWCAELYYQAEARATDNRVKLTRPYLVRHIGELKNRLNERIANTTRAGGEDPSILAKLADLALILEFTHDEIGRRLSSAAGIAEFQQEVKIWEANIKNSEHWKNRGIQMREEAFRSLAGLDKHFAKKLRQGVSSILEAEFGQGVDSLVPIENSERANEAKPDHSDPALAA